MHKEYIPPLIDYEIKNGGYIKEDERAIVIEWAEKYFDAIHWEEL